MRVSIIRKVLGSLALTGVIAYTMGLPSHPTAQLPAPVLVTAPTAAALSLSSPSTLPEDSTLIAGPSIGASGPLPVVPARRTHIIDHCFNADSELSAPILRGPNPVITAALKQDWEIVRKLLDAGAAIETADETGLTSLMVAAKQGNIEMVRTLLELGARIDFMDFEGRTALHYAIASRKHEALELLLANLPDFRPWSATGRDLFTAALQTGEMKIFHAVLERFPGTLEWTADTRRALDAAIKADMREQVRLLLTKHPLPPTRDGGVVPLIAYAIANDEASLFHTLLACGTDPNIAIPKTAEKEFMSLLQNKYLRLYIANETGVNLLMLAAGLGRTDYVRALLDAGANRSQATPKHKMLPLYFAAWTSNWKCVQLLLGGGPMPEQLRVEISLAKQHATVIKDGIEVFTTQVSTGRAGYSTPAGQYVITDKDRDHISTIYKVAMPYFMRLNCRDFGMHAGVVPRYPASHGCIRLPGDAAKKLFSEIPVGTVVMIN
jgi:ankyrin repeat protein